jgi:hypothetical protein
MTNTAVVIGIDGILMRKVSSAPIPVGLQFYHALSSGFTVLLASDQDKETTDYWLKLEGLNKHSGVSYTDGILAKFDARHRRERQLTELRQRGYHIALVFDPNPNVTAYLIGSGYSACTFTDSAYADPEWRPDFEKKIKPWNEYADEVERMALLRAEDRRNDPEKPMAV